MTLGTWYSFEDDDHTYGYTLFFPLEYKKYYYGVCISCNDSGPNWGSRSSAWNYSHFGYLEEHLQDVAMEYYDKRGSQPPHPKEIIEQIFSDNSDFISILKDDEWIR